MKLTLAILLCRLTRRLGALLGRGSSLPGKLALKLCPDALRRLALPKYVVAVTGSNGKTSTVELMAHILRQNGLRVAYNKEGSNQIEGVATFLLCAADLRGRVRADVVLLESDERFARHTFRHFAPTHYVILNLFRDQLTRNVHPQWMYRIVKDSIRPESRLILNADDPLVARYGLDRDNVTWFGVGAQSGESAGNTAAYDDGAVCPACMAPMTYSFRHFNHIGGYSCAACGHRRPDPRYIGTALDLEAGALTVSEGAGAVRLPLPMRSWYGAYNVLAAYAACRELDVPPAAIADALTRFASASGRAVSFTLGIQPGRLLVSKHENSISYDQSIRVVAQSSAPAAVLILVDAISRKYFTSETSWLWDVDFEALAADNVLQVVLSGRYAHDLAVRFSVIDIPPERLLVEPDLPAAVARLKESCPAPLTVITCFSDKDKFLRLVEVTP